MISDSQFQFYLHVTHLSGSGQTKNKSQGTDSECYRTLPGLQPSGLDGDDALDDGVEEAEALADAEHDHRQVEEDTPERGDVLRAEDGEVGWDELSGESVDLNNQSQVSIQVT